MIGAYSKDKHFNEKVKVTPLLKIKITYPGQLKAYDLDRFNSHIMFYPSSWNM